MRGLNKVRSNARTAGSLPRIGEATPDGVQHLLERARWDADAARDVLREFVVERLGEREAVLIVDEKGIPQEE
jgi:SRSO17 transposase